MRLTRSAVMAVAMLCASVSYAAVQSVTEPDTVVLLRVAGKLRTEPAFDSKADCERAIPDIMEADGAAKTSGRWKYNCEEITSWFATFAANPTVPACAPPRAPIAEVMTCPAGTVGGYTRTKSWTAAPAPQCEIEGEWIPSSPPAEYCLPDQDGDGVADAADQCPTVHASTPNGCPPPPPPLAAPIVTATGISTSQIRIEWTAVPNAAAYSLERCIGATCTSFSGLSSYACTTVRTATHTSLQSAGLSVSYRVRAARDVACTDFGPYSSIVVGRTLAAAPVNCAVSAWSAWSEPAWPATCPPGVTQTRTETRTRTVTTQPANGGTACPALTESRTATRTCPSGGTGGGGAGTARLSWQAPTRRVDGSTFDNLQGYVMSYGRLPTELVYSTPIAPSASAHEYTNLAAGTWYFAICARSQSGIFSDYSSVVQKVVQ